MSATLVESMLMGRGLTHAAHAPELIETHISWVVLVGDYAYKLKKPVDFGFLDFSTLALRRFYCEEEVRLNRRTAPHIYLRAVAISGDPGNPCVDDDTDPFEYAVQMTRVSHLETLDDHAATSELHEDLLLDLAATIADFHQALPQDHVDKALGTPDVVHRTVEDNFTTLMELDRTREDQGLLRQLRQWHQQRFVVIRDLLQQRHDSGFVRECHGDLHLHNIYTDGHTCTLFDCIEFSAELRCIDTASDIAFLLMDLHHRDLASAANLLRNEYLQLTGDYGALPLLDYLIVYRALVRAKVDSLRDHQAHDAELITDCTRYLQLAQSFTVERKPQLILMCGLSGTGKTFAARRLAAAIGAIHLRSDVERKRLFAVPLLARSQDHGIDIYSFEASQRTFDRLAEISADALQAGYPVVADATFINAAIRERFASIAQSLEVPWTIVHCEAPAAVVRERLVARQNDASEAGYEQYLEQQRNFDAFSPAETRHVIPLDTTSAAALAALAVRVMDEGTAL